MLFQVSSSLFAQSVDLSRHEVHAFGSWYLSVMAGVTNLKVCELTKAPGTPSVARIGCPHFRPYGRRPSGMLPFGCLNQLPQDGVSDNNVRQLSVTEKATLQADRGYFRLAGDTPQVLNPQSLLAADDYLSV